MRGAVCLLACLAVPTTALAQGPVNGWAEKLFLKNGVVQTNHDFGTVPRGALLSHPFVLKNIYAVPLTITHGRPTCGCVSITLPANPTVPPLGTATIEVTMDARRFTGPKTVQFVIQVANGAQFNSSALLSVTANSRGDVVFNPGSVNFGVVPQGQARTQGIDVEYAGTLNWAITGVEKGDAPLDVKLSAPVRKPGGVAYRLEVTLKTDAPPDSPRWELRLQTNDPASPVLPVLVEASVLAPLAVVPNSVGLGRVAVGQTVSRRVVLRGSGKPFRILQVDGQGEGLTVELPGAAAAVQILTIKYQPTKAGELRTQLIFRTDLAKDSTAAARVEGTAVEGP